MIVVFIYFSDQDSLAQTSENSRTFLNAIRLYREGQFKPAADEFLKIAQTGVRNGKLFYNLGNTYLKIGKLGHSILWYERALKLIPNDPDLKFNLNFARTLVKDKREEQRPPLLNVLFFWQDLFSEKSIQWIAIISNMVFWLILASYLSPIPSLKTATSVKVFKYLSLAIALVFSLTAFYQYFAKRYINYGIILPEKVSVRSGLTETATELFLLHSGTKVKIERQDRDYYRIYFSRDKIGWLKKTHAAMI
jgi:tetratricopeptide (TPR) repeat protein